VQVKVNGRTKYPSGPPGTLVDDPDSEELAQLNVQVVRNELKMDCVSQMGLASPSHVQQGNVQGRAWNCARALLQYGLTQLQNGLARFRCTFRRTRVAWLHAEWAVKASECLVFCCTSSTQIAANASRRTATCGIFHRRRYLTVAWPAGGPPDPWRTVLHLGDAGARVQKQGMIT
jgi:hypothetical protein